MESAKAKSVRAAVTLMISAIGAMIVIVFRQWPQTGWVRDLLALLGLQPRRSGNPSWSSPSLHRKINVSLGLLGFFSANKKA